MGLRALTEDEIQRFSRQILLKEVGGVGQARLLSAQVALEGEGPVFDVAARYLVAGGTPVGSTSPSLVIGGTSPVDRAIARVTLGGREDGGARIGFRAAGTCDACFEGRIPAGPVPEGVATVHLGALVALVVQGLVLGRLGGMGGLEVSAAGEIGLIDVRCTCG